MKDGSVPALLPQKAVCTRWGYDNVHTRYNRQDEVVTGSGGDGWVMAVVVVIGVVEDFFQ